jgi:curved DNA-binding protein CbpA
MTEDYYKILKLTPNCGLLTLSIRYLRLSRKFLRSKIPLSSEAFFQINRAFEVLRIPEVRKYYDIIYNENKNNTLDLNNAAIIRYSDIILTYTTLGNQKAEKLINNQEYIKETKITQSWLLIVLNFIFYFNPLGRLINIPLMGIFYIVLSIVLVCANSGFNNPTRLAPGIMFLLLGLIIILFNFRQFIIDRANN